MKILFLVLILCSFSIGHSDEDSPLYTPVRHSEYGGGHRTRIGTVGFTSYSSGRREMTIGSHTSVIDDGERSNLRGESWLDD